MPDPLVSVVVPVHNAAGTIAETIASVRAQELDDWELILVDDASTDDSMVRAEEACAGMVQPVVRLTTGAPAGHGSGPAAARNVGIAAAGGELLACLDADDVWTSDFLASRADELLADPDLGLVWGPSLYWHPERSDRDDYVQTGWFAERRRRFEPGEVIPYWLGLLRSTPCPGSTLMRTAAAREVGGYPTELRRGEDIALCLRIALDRPVRWDDRVAHWYRRHPESSTSKGNTSRVATAHNLAFARWAMRFVAARPTLRCEAIAARNLHNAAREVADLRPAGTQRWTLVRTLLAEPAFASFRWCTFPLLALRRARCEQLMSQVYRWLGADTTARQLPAMQSYRGLEIRAAANTHLLAADLAVSAGLGPTTRALDLGAGEGALTARLLDLGVGSVDACELEPGRFAVPDVTCRAIDLDRDFTADVDGPYDLVTAVEIVEHLDNPGQFLRHVARLLTPGGHLVLSSPNVTSWFSRLRFLRTGELHWFSIERSRKDGHIHPLFDWQVIEWGRAAGLEVVDRRATADDLLRNERLRDGTDGPSLRGWLNRSTLTYLLARPLMRGATDGEIAVWLLRNVGDD